MKKIVLTVLCVMSMLIGLTGCAVQEKEEVNVAGTWELTAVKLDNRTYVEPEYLGDYDYSFTLTEEGNATATVLGITYTTTYEVKNGWITFADADLASIKLEIADDTLEMQLSVIGGGLVFERQ